ncbi:MAG TPA: heavy-metal-associated domain-containing protein [Firmicutes bacterium]|nr:heavy-metal-associated domain-containing protein [Candidatus Fermentithermobacillaceae bacterium]
MKAQTYMLQDLNCPNCAAKLQKAVAGLPGVSEARVSFGTGALNVQFDEAVLDEQKIKDTVRKFNLEILTVLPGRAK